MLKIIVCFIVYLPLFSFADDCLNVLEPRARIIYLHGMNLERHTINEKKRRAIFKRVSKEQNIEMFLPRATMVCPKNKNMLCWMWGSDSVNSLKTKWSKILNRSKKCFKSETKLLFLGFSNGGNFLNQVFQSCAGGKYISVGASGGRVVDKQVGLSTCGSYIGAIGKNDIHVYKKGKNFIGELKKQKARVEFIEFDGGHELPEPVLINLLKRHGI